MTRRAKGAWLGVAVSTVLLAAPALAQDDALAFVNGKPIDRAEVVELLMDSHGVDALQQLILLRLAKEQSYRLRLTVTQADIEREFDDALRRIVGDGEGEKLTQAQRERALQMLLDERRISKAEFMIGMERNAHLRAIVEQEFHVDEATLREEFARTHGELAEVRHIQIQVNDNERLNTVQSALRAGKDFAEVARQYSQNPETAARGGLLAPFAHNADDRVIPPALREAAFSLEPGEVSSPIHIDRAYQIIKLERRIPPRGVKFEDVRDEVEAELRRRVIPQEMNELLGELFKSAKIQIVERSLRRKFQEMLERNEAGGD